jgi:hypothetical protein
MNIWKIPVNSSPRQSMRFQVGDLHVGLTLYYNPVPDGGTWVMDLIDADSNDVLVSGYSLVCGVPILKRTTLPFWFRLVDISGLHLNPYNGNDLGTRCLLYVVEK